MWADGLPLLLALVAIACMCFRLSQVHHRAAVLSQVISDMLNAGVSCRAAACAERGLDARTRAEYMEVG